MTRVILGTNAIENCDSAITIAGVPLFSYKIDGDKISLTFNISSPPATAEIQIIDNIVYKGEITLKTAPNSVFVKFRDNLLIDLLINVDSAIVNLDLRHIGINIYTDTNALHIGGSQLSQNVISQCSSGIVVG
ncbi:MAG: hypothetical protein HZA10_01465 [Nitrospirae bacterium]|nr:hypothetical protein [Nitrospirota bacterium]